MSALEMREAIVRRLREAVPALRLVGSHGGDLTAGALDRMTVNSPSAFVVCLGPGVFADEGDITGNWRWGVFVFARDAGSPPRSRHDIALGLAESIGGLVHLDRWSDLATDQASDVRILNLFSEDLDTRGIAVWMVEWRQSAVAVPATAFDELDDFLLARTTHDIGETPSTEEPVDELELEPPTP